MQVPKVDNLANYFQFENTTLRLANRHDIKALVKLINEAYSYQDAAKGEPRTSVERLEKRMKEVNFYAISAGEQLIGCVYVEPKEKSLHFGLLTLVPNYRGAGIAAHVISSIERYALKNNFQLIELDYMSLAPWLKNYYERYGFCEDGQVTKWGTIDLVRMSKAI